MVLAAVTATILLAACSTNPPPSLAPREALIIRAPVAKAWNATIDEFAASNIAIKNLDRSSGFVSTEPMSVTRDASEAYADCGTVMGMPIKAVRATYNVVIRGDSAAATVHATVQFTTGGRPGLGDNDPAIIKCASTGRWENAFEARIKDRAEAKPPNE